MFRKATTVVGLFGALALLGLLHQPSPDAFNAEAMAVLGFIVLAAFMLGDLAESIHLPHITGYLLTGVICGPDILGLLDHDVIRDLKLFDHLAVALIALSAGAALTIETLRKGARLLSAVMVSQFFFSLLIVGGLVVLCSGVIPGFALPFLVEESWGFKLAAALCLGLVASAMSPAATIAVVHETGSKGPITDSVMGISILNNVIVVVLFAFGLSIAGVLAPEYYTAHSEHSVAATLATSIGGAAVLGGVLGIGLALYIRTLGKELLLIITGLCFTLTWVAQQTGIDPVLSFIVAGFVARNAFPKEEISLSRIITKLSLPVYVVFFFLAGAGLHIDAVIQLWPFALLLFGGRLLALYLGTRIGSNIGKGPEGLKSYGWLGFGAQAGIALSMAKALEHSFGETGLALETLAVAGVALNELCGPVLLKICLGIAGETQTQTTKSIAPPSQTEKDPPIASGSAEVETPSDKLPEWIPESQPGLADPWGAPPTDHHKKVLRIYRNSRAELQSLVRDLRDGPVTSRRQIGRDFIAQLRREFLRYHRRCLVIARDPNTQRDDFIAKLASHRAQLAARWQDHILDRSAMANYRVEKEAIDDLIRAVDALIAGMPVSLVVPMDPELLQPHENDSVALRARMWMVRAKGGMGDRDPERSIEVENLARYTFGSELTDHLHQVAALLAVTDRHLMSRARNIFEVYRRSLAQAVQSEAFKPGSWDEVLNQVRKELEEEFDLALAEVDRLAEEAVRAASIALASPHQSFSNLLKIAGSPRLPPKAYQASKVYDQRVKAVERIHQGLESARGLSRGVGNGLAMELELVRLQTRVRSLIQDRAREFGRDLHGRAALQATRISEGLHKLTEIIQEGVDNPSVERAALEEQIREATESFSKLLHETKGISTAYMHALESESALDPLRSELSVCIDMVKDRFDVAEKAPSLTGRGLPPEPKIRSVPFRRLVRQYMDAEVSRGLSVLLQEVTNTLRGLVNSLDELERGLTYNAEVCLAELEVIEDGVVTSEARSILQEMLLQTLERHSKRVQEEEGKCEEVASAAEEKVFEVVMNHLEDLQTMLVDGRYGEMEAQLAKAQAFARKRALKGQLFSLKELSNTVAQISRALFGEEGTRKIRGALGFKESQDTVELNPTTFQIHQTPIDIPVVYRRIFQDPSLEARDMLTGREKDVERLQKHLMGQTGSPSRAGAVLFEGATNGGALLQAVARGLSQDIRVVRHSLKATTSTKDVQEILQSASGGCLVLVEDLRFLVKLEAGGLEPLRQLVEGILEDNGKNAWMVSCEQSSWDYLHHHIPLEGIFPERIHVGQLSTLELRRAILERHGMSGFSLEYEEMESSVLWRFGKRLRRQAAAMDANEAQVFEGLHQESGGILRDALALWIASVRHLNAKKDALRIGKTPKLPLAAIMSLPEDVLLSLRQIARQGRLEPEEHAVHFQLNPTTSESHLAQLAHWGLIRRSEESSAYVLNTDLEGCIYRALTAKELAG